MENNTENEVLEWINSFFRTFLSHTRYEVSFLDGRSLTSGQESACEAGLNNLFRAGYCWHFAHMLKNTFDRGEVCWAAPFAHICWVDDDKTAYDIEGVYQGEAFYMIPEKYCGKNTIGFRHVQGVDYASAKDELIQVVKKYCEMEGVEYNPEIEDWFKD